MSKELAQQKTKIKHKNKTSLEEVKLLVSDIWSSEEQHLRSENEIIERKKSNQKLRQYDTQTLRIARKLCYLMLFTNYLYPSTRVQLKHQNLGEDALISKINEEEHITYQQYSIRYYKSKDNIKLYEEFGPTFIKDICMYGNKLDEYEEQITMLIMANSKKDFMSNFSTNLPKSEHINYGVKEKSIRETAFKIAPLLNAYKENVLEQIDKDVITYYEYIYKMPEDFLSSYDKKQLKFLEEDVLGLGMFAMFAKKKDTTNTNTKEENENN